MTIEPLADNVHAIPLLADWYTVEWELYYGASGPGDADADLRARCNREQLPVGFVALDGDEILGTAALDVDMSTNLSPSIVGLLVNAEHRRRGVATALLMTLEEHARKLGFRQVFASASVMTGLLERLGWRRMSEVRFLNDESGSILVRELDDSGTA
jgi:GNAT superfamily N-acetyltransferase